MHLETWTGIAGCIALLVAAVTSHALPAAPDDVAAAARSAAKTGTPERAIALYREALRRDPKWADGWQELGILLADREEFREAKEAFHRLAGLRPNDGDALALLGLAEFRERRYDAALQHLESARSLPFRTPGLYRLLEYHVALILIARAEFDSARRRLDKLATLSVNTVELAEAEGLAALHMRVLPAELSDSDRRVARDVGAVVLASKRLPAGDVLPQWKRLFEIYPNLRWLRYSFGVYLASVGEMQDAVVAFEHELRGSPANVWPVVQIAACKLSLGQPEAALRYADRAIELDPNLFAGFLFRGRALLHLERDAEAIAPLERAAALEPQSRQLYRILQTAYVRVGRREDARRAGMRADSLGKSEQLSSGR